MTVQAVHCPEESSRGVWAAEIQPAHQAMRCEGLGIHPEGPMFSNLSQSAMELGQPCPQGTGSRTQDIPDVPGENSLSG